MKTNKLLDKIQSVLQDTNENKGRKNNDALKKAIKRLKSKQKELESKASDAMGSNKEKLQKKAKIVKAQRKKALKILKDM